MTLFALATGLRKSNVAELEWNRVDMARRCCFIPGYLSKSGQPIPVPLNEDAMDVLKRWQELHVSCATQWAETVRRHVFVYRRRVPIKQITTAMWRRECKAVGLEGVTFHSMRHAWASWQTQAGTPMRIPQELGGWASLQMPQRYSHLDPGILADFADRTLLRGDPREESVKEDDKAGDADPQVLDFSGKGGTRTRRRHEPDQ